MVSTFDNNIGGTLMLRDYWNRRYKRGGNSGHGSIGKERIWKWSIIQQYVKIEDCSVLDLGCGDMTFWGDIRPRAYIGLDYSAEIIAKNRAKYFGLNFYREDLTKPRITTPAVDVVFCFDMLFHQPSTCNFLAVLSYLNSVDAKMLFLTNFETMPSKSGGHMSYRVLEKYRGLLSNWSVVKVCISPIDQKLLYVFQRVAVEE